MNEDELKAAYNKLEQSYTLVQQMLNGSAAAISMFDAVWDTGGRITHFIYREGNRAAEKLHRMSNGNLHGKRLSDIFPDAKQNLFNAFVKVTESGEAVQIEYQFPYHYFEEETWFDIHVVRNSNGIILTYLDITKQKKAETAITEQSHFINSIVNTVPDIISVMDVNTLRLEFVNPEVLKLNGFDPDKIVKQNKAGAHSVTDPAYREALEEYFSKLRRAKDEEVLTADYRARTDNGEWQWFRVRGRIFRRNAQGKPTHCVNVVQNITYQKYIEEEREQALKIQRESERLATIGDINRTLAHEIRNPLSTITMAISMIEEEANKLHNDVLKQYAEMTQRNARRIDKLITDMLYIYKQQRKAEPCAIKDLLEDAILLATDRLTLEGIVIEKDYRYSCNLLLDKESVIIALLSIISNAIEAMQSDKGTLRISTEEQDGHCHILIQDNGRGIPAKDLDKIFDPFFSRKTYGMGLGLSNAQDIIKRNSGSIKVSSEDGKGTTFIVEFPVA
jgi:PAS domain S-box-containing protein